MQNKKRVQKLSSVQDPHKVKVLILTDQKTIYSDFYFINKFVNIVKLDLSYNKLSNFPIGFSFRAFPVLRTLFLHYNKFTSIKSVQIVGESIRLEYLTLFGNPLQETKTRHYFVNQIQSLKLMDDKIIRMEERNHQLLLNNEQQVIKMTFPIVPNLQSEGSAYFLSAVITQLKIIREKYLQMNPIIKIQRWYKKILGKRRLVKLSKQRNILDEIQVLRQPSPKSTPKKQRLITEKLQINNSNEDKILSLLLMNTQFLHILKNQASKKVFALKSFCIKEGISYSQNDNKIICLRAPESGTFNDGKSYLSLIINSCQKFLLRRKGSQLSMNIRSKFRFLQKLLKKNYKHRKYPKIQKLKQTQKNQELSLKINKIENQYSECFVLITESNERKYKLMKQQYYKCLQNKTIFPFCLQEIVERSAAALSIQRMWRGYISRKKVINSYQKIIRNHAAYLIQRNVRNYGFTKRSSVLIDLIDYAKKQQGSSQMIFNMHDVLGLKAKCEKMNRGINFVLPDQRLKYGVESESNKLFIEGCQKINFPEYFQKAIQFPKKDNVSQQNQEILDLIFRGAKFIKYFTDKSSVKQDGGPNLKRQQSFIKSQKLHASKSTTTLGGSGVVVINNQIADDLKLSQQKSSVKFVIVQFKQAQECLLRKILIALLTFELLQNRFMKSIKINFKQNTTAIKKINQRVENGYFIKKMEENDKIPKDNGIEQSLAQREKFSILKLKLFVQQQDLSTKVKIFWPLSQKNLKKQVSLALPLNHLKRISNYNQSGSIRSKRQLFALQHTANITRNVLSLYPSQIESQASQANFFTHRQYENVKNNNLPYRYQELQTYPNKRKSLEKSQSLQASKNDEYSSRAYFITMDKNLDKSYTTQINVQSGVDHQSNHIKKNTRYQSIEDDQQTKKKKINMIRDSHKSKVEQNNRYKKQQLSKLRVKISDEMEANNKIIQTSRQQGTLINAKRHEMIRKALGKKLTDIQKFEKDFLKRGNSSIRKDLIKFENQRSSKSPDNQSIYESLKSLQSQAFKNHLKNRSKRIFNLKTQIKQFSIDGSDGDPDLSLGAIQLDNRSKGMNRKLCQQKTQRKQYMEGEAVEVVKKAKSHKKDAKKKKVVHSVFPQQFYPLKESKKLGFQLPRIIKK